MTAVHRLDLLMERTLYSYSDVDRILGLTPGSSRRWLNGYHVGNKEYPPVVRPQPEATDRVRWGEFIEVYYLARFRASGIPLQRLRATLESVRERTGDHYLFVHDKVLYAEPDLLEVIYQAQVETGVLTFLVKRTGQTMLTLFPDARERLIRINYAENGLARAVKPRMDLDHVVVAVDRFFGKPKIEDTGISPEAVAGLVRNGTPIEVVADLYDLGTAIINEAGRFSYGDRWVSAA